MFGLPEVYEDADKMQKLMDKQAELQDKIDASVMPGNSIQNWRSPWMH